jgi:hypothetical protein
VTPNEQKVLRLVYQRPGVVLAGADLRTARRLAFDAHPALLKAVYVGGFMLTEAGAEVVTTHLLD